jgi:autoinducer 2-degrading protein
VSRIALVVEFDVKPESRTEFEAVIRSHAARTLEAESGCLQFDVLIPQEDTGKVFLYECYRDGDALKEHAKSPILADTREKYKDMIENRRITVCSAS